jgi:hypothetical protein
VAKISEQIKMVFWWVKPVYALFSWWKGLILLALAIGSFVWAMIDHLPWSVIAAVVYTATTSTIYLLLLPSMFRVLGGERPAAQSVDFKIYSRMQEFRLKQAACLLANVSPQIPYPTAEASDWAAALTEAIRSGRLKRVETDFDNGSHYFPLGGGYHPHHDTMIPREELKKFAAQHDRHPEFLIDI